MLGAAVTSTIGPTFSDVQTDDSSTFVIGLRENATAHAKSLILFQAEDDPDQQDSDLGMDTYCLVVEPGQATTYGGVLECELQPKALRLRLTEDAAGVLGIPADTTFPLSVDAAQLDELRRGLYRVLTSGSSDLRPRLRGI